MNRSLCSDKASDYALDAVMKQSEAENYGDLFKAAKLIREELEKHQKWKFTGSFNDFVVPTHLETLLRWIIVSPNVSLYKGERQRSVDKSVLVTSQLVMQSFKTSRQVRYEGKAESNRGMNSTIETPLSVGIGLYIHQKTRSKEIIDTLYDLNLSISSNKVACIKHDVSAAVINKAAINNSVYIPSVVSPSNRLYFAVDNTDTAIDTPDGKKQLHGTAMAVYQRSDAFHEQQPLKLKRTTKVQKSADTKPFYESVF